MINLSPFNPIIEISIKIESFDKAILEYTVKNLPINKEEIFLSKEEIESQRNIYEKINERIKEIRREYGEV